MSEQTMKGMANSFPRLVQQLVGKEGKLLKIENPEQYHFDPKRLLELLMRTILVFSKERKFVVCMNEEKTLNLEMFEKAMENIMPNLECKTRRVGGANYQVPLEVSPARRETLGLRWLTQYSRARGEKTMSARLAAEIIDATNGVGGSVKKREDTHKMAEANKAFAHYRY